MRKINNNQINNLIKALNTPTPFSKLKGVMAQLNNQAFSKPKTIPSIKITKTISPKK